MSLGAISGLAGLAGGLGGALPVSGLSGGMQLPPGPSSSATGGTADQKNNIAPEGFATDGASRGITLNFTGKGSAKQDLNTPLPLGDFPVTIALGLLGLVVVWFIYKSFR